MSFETLQPWPLVVIFAALLVRGTFGFGDALVAMPLLLLLLGKDAAAPLVALFSTTLAAIVLWQDWRQVHLRDAASLILSAFAGVVLGLVFLARVNEAAAAGFLGGVVILSAGYALLAPPLGKLKSDRSAPLFGIAAGILSGAFNAPGPPLVIYGSLRGWTAEKFRATMQAFFLPTSLVVVAGHGVAGRLNVRVLTYFLAGLPLVVVCTALGRHINARFRREGYTRALYLLLLGMGVMLVAHSFV